LEDLVIGIIVLRPDPGCARKIREKISDRFSGALGRSDPDYKAAMSDLAPEFLYIPFSNIIAIVNDMQVEVPALALVRGLDDIIAAPDPTLELVSKSREVFPDLINRFFVELAVRDIPIGKCQKPRPWPCRDYFVELVIMLSEPLGPALSAGPFSARESNAAMVSALNTEECNELMGIFCHLLLSA
jgi:hypothetical protein